MNPVRSGLARAGVPRRQRGFALAITLGLLAFLLLVLLGMAALTRLELRASQNALHQAQARQNALLALNVALGRLQKFAGPDSRVTATAASFSAKPGTVHYTGVWDAAGSGPAPLTWLVSGNEGDDALVVTPAGNSDGIELLGVATSGTRGDVVAPRQAILPGGGPGSPATADAGGYAWWIGDEGVKADIALADLANAVTSPPFDSPELRRRLGQQVAGGAGPADVLGETIFEPRDGVNSPVAGKVIATSQIAFLHRPDGAGLVGPDLVRQNFHAWTVGSGAVLASTGPGGLRRDLSLRPDCLGAAFAAWSDYGAYMEDPSAPGVPAIMPAYPATAARDGLRRRYRMTAPVMAAGIAHGVAPVLSYFLLTFNIRTDQAVSGPTRPLEVRARWMATLWNPYTSALVPEDLQLEVTGLPDTEVVNDTAGVSVANVGLDVIYGAPLRISLPWQPAGRADQQSWLPGRVYTWCALENIGKGSVPPAAGFASAFYTRNLNTAAGQGVQRAVPFATLSNSALTHLRGVPSQLTLRLYRSLASGGRELLRTWRSPAFAGFSTTPTAASAATYQFSFVFHLGESNDTPALPNLWLTSPGQDPREAVLPPGAFLSGANGPRPELYPNYTSISFPDRLLDRALPASAGSLTGQSYNEDTPLFELPRGPLLSVGGLQHLALPGLPPFTIGNSWGQTGHWNELFDRYFFSGLARDVALPDLAAGGRLPNPLLRVVGRRADGGVVTAADLVAPGLQGYSSSYLLQGGAFNLNSVDALAWQAVLRGGRYTGGSEFSYLAAAAGTGTNADSAQDEQEMGKAVFFRFPESAQETFQADAGYAASTTVPPAAPNTVSLANTHLFRRGVRSLSAEQTALLAQAIVSRVRRKIAVSGPYRSLAEFLDASPLFGDVSLLEEAIGDVTTADGRHLNDPGWVPEFSSQWLTQADMLSLLAPILFVRSDTFRIRAYGDKVNPLTGDVEGRAWCEAVVQRLPQYLDASEPPATAPESLNSLNLAYGRRFQVVDFRWLTHADI